MPSLRGWAYRHPVRGMERDDVVQEMLIELWRVMHLHDPERGPLDAFFWRNWHWKHDKLWQYWRAKKRGDEVFIEDLYDVDYAAPDEIDADMFEWPPEASDKERKIWLLTAMGFNQAEISRILGYSSKQTVNNTFAKWRGQESEIMPLVRPGQVVTPPIIPVTPTTTGFDSWSTGQREIFHKHVQGTPASVWVISHNLGYRPGGVTVIDSGGGEQVGRVQYVDDSTVHISFFSGGKPVAFSGEAYLS
jgi:DNA-directed RNA polymerase specialized sigma24 family protein